MIYKVIIAFFFSNILFSQECTIQKNEYGLGEVGVEEIKCMAKNYNGYTLIYTFGLWCEPCIVHLDTLFKITEEYSLNLGIIVIDKNESNFAYSKTFLESKKKNVNVLSIKDSYGKRANKQYKIFLTEITPEKFLNIGGMSKYILLNNKGEVLMVTNWKDGLEGENWRNDMPMLKRKIIPILEQ